MRTPPRRLLAAAALAGAVLVGPARPARGQPPVQLVVDPCVDASREEVERLAAVEIGAAPLPAEAVAPDVTRLTVVCVGALSELQIDDPVTGKTSQRLIDLSAVPPGARARLLALALAELVAASWAELEVVPAPRVPPARPLATPAVRQAAAAVVRQALHRPALRIVAFGGLRVPLQSERAPLGGAGVRLLGAHRGGLGWALDVLYHHGQDTTPLGAVRTDLLSLGAMLLYHRDLRRAGLYLGGGVRGGAARVFGEPDPGRRAVGGTVWGPTLSLAATGGVDVRLGQLLLSPALELGYVLVPVLGRVAGGGPVGIDGPWLGLRLGIGVAP